MYSTDYHLTCMFFYILKKKYVLLMFYNYHLLVYSTDYHYMYVLHIVHCSFVNSKLRKNENKFYKFIFGVRNLTC